MLLRGEHVQGEFYSPLATSEGTLVASYNRGMKVLHESGGVKCAVVGDNMQRAPVFVFEDAAQARLFANWIVTNTNEIKSVSEASDPFIRLKHIDYYLVSKFAYLRFNYTTGDAAGQKHGRQSDLRGKRVTAEAVIKRDVLLDIMHVDTESIYYHSKLANIGTLLSGANNNGCHSANAITAVFMATGQDVANVNKFAEIVAGTVLAGEISLAAVISSLDWVSSHEQMGRNNSVKGKL